MNKKNNHLLSPEMNNFNLINSILDVIIELNLDFTITYINPQVYGVFGYFPEDIIGKSARDFIHPDDVSKLFESIKKAINTRETISEEFRINHKKGYYIPVFARGCLVELNNQSRIVAVLRDITEIKETQRKSMESDKRYREIIENIEDGYFELDIQGNYTYVNDYTCKYLGILKKDLIGKNPISFLDKNSVEEVLETFRKVFSKNLPKGTFISKVTRNDGKERTIEGTFYLRYNSTGKKIGFYGFTRDISERIKIEEKIRESEEKYREAYKRAELYKDLFYHDINNILSIMKLSIEISERYLDESGKEREIKDLYELIKGQFERGTKLISNVRKLSILEDLEKTLISVDAIETLEEAIKFVKNSMSLECINIIIESLEENIIVRANEFLIDVFDNLLINAIKYNENIRKEVLIKSSRESKNNINYIKFEFIDNGIGISNRRKEIIFQKGLNKRKGSKGLGFGLTLVRKIIESYKGKIWIEDKVEGDYTQGSKFIFLIPEAEM